MRTISTALALALALAAGPLSAHDFWIEPSSFRPEVHSTVTARLMVGQNFQGEAVARNPALILKFLLSFPGGEVPLDGRSGDDPAGSAEIAVPGLQALQYRSGNSLVSLEAQKFEDYLREEGLERIIAVRAGRDESQKPSRELFSRCAKALLFAGPLGTAGDDRELGLTLELVAEKNPYGLRAGSALPVRLLYEGKPLEGALVTALPHGPAKEKLSARTDRHGRVQLHLPYGGVWLLKAVHMIPAPPGSGADWQSLWASLTFEIPTAVTVGNAP
jgi:uncharacterized GH25 family protein